MSLDVALDFGTDRTLIAFSKGKSQPHPEIILPADGSSSFPSSVYLDHEGLLRTGKNAGGYVYEISGIKRLLGITPPSAAIRKRHFSYPVFWSSKGRARIEHERGEYTAVEIASALLEYLNRICENRLGKVLHKATIPVPVDYDNSQMSDLQKAALLAGIEEIDFVDDLTAAALSYWRIKKKRGNIFFYFFGAGYFQAGIVHIADKSLQVLSSFGSSDFGASDIDAIIADNLVNEISLQHGQKLNHDMNLYSHLIKEADKAKRAISHRGSYDFRIHDKQRKINFDRAFSRFELEELVGQKISDQMKHCKKVLKEAKLEVDNIEEAVLVGAATRMPLIHKMLQAFFQKKVHFDMNPDQIIVLGATFKNHLSAPSVEDIRKKA